MIFDHKVGRGLFGVASFFRFGIGCLVLLGACGGDSDFKADAGLVTRVWNPGVPLPEPVSNNAVASVETEGGCMVFSLTGIGAERDQQAIHNRGFRWREGDPSWISLPPIPGPDRVAANAVGLRGEPYLLGGYEVLDDGTEVTSPQLQRFDLRTGQWVSLADVPVPVDDAGVVNWGDRYIITVSGWSNTGTVDAVQVYDVESDSWSAATAFPGSAVFGQSAALVGDELIVIDGVTSSFGGFALVNQAWRGRLDPNNPETIVWEALGEHPGPARYRAAPGATADGELWFHGGTAEPYNFDGLRYDNDEAAQPLASTLAYDEGSFAVDSELDKPEATMDHRALVPCGPRLMSVGGMKAGPEVSAQVWTIFP